MALLYNCSYPAVVRNFDVDSDSDSTDLSSVYHDAQLVTDVAGYYRSLISRGYLKQKTRLLLTVNVPAL